MYVFVCVFVCIFVHVRVFVCVCVCQNSKPALAAQTERQDMPATFGKRNAKNDFNPRDYTG